MLTVNPCMSDAIIRMWLSTILTLILSRNHRNSSDKTVSVRISECGMPIFNDSVRTLKEICTKGVVIYKADNITLFYRKPTL